MAIAPALGGLEERVTDAAADLFEVKLKKTSPVLLVLLVVFTLGLALPLLLIAWLLDKRPKLLDREGLTTVRGKRFLWRDLQDTKTHARYNRQQGPKAMPIDWWVDLRFSTGTLRFQPVLLDNGFDALAFIERVTGKSFGRPLPREQAASA